MTWQFWIDVGGTFTDCIARRPDGKFELKKVLSSGVTKGRVARGSTAATLIDAARAAEPAGFWIGYRLRLIDDRGETIARATVVDHTADGRLQLSEPLREAPHAGGLYELSADQESPLLAIRLCLGLPLASPIPPVIVRLGTTRGTNALLTRRGARTAFVTTRGFADVLRIGYQNRPRLFDLVIHKPAPLFETEVEVDERITSAGDILRPLDEPQAREQLSKLRELGIHSLAICLLNSYVNARHEDRLAELAAELGFSEVSVSSRVAPRMKIVPRGDTTVVDAYLNPVLRDYVSRLAAALPESHLRLLTSAGGLVSAERFTGKDSILSGPAGGVVGMSRAAEAAGFSRAVGFDMGGTSTDVARYEGQYEYELETEKAGVRIVAPMLAIETVAAGGGSICRFDGARLVVGPESAGADPGPACYGGGGPLTVTDANFFLGRLDERHFPFPLDRAAVAARLRETARLMHAADGSEWSPEALAAGFIRIADAAMARAIRSISIAKGYDPRDYVLVAFGGAAAQHSCAVAEELGMTQVLLHPCAGLLSALGAGSADVTRQMSAPVYQTWDAHAQASIESLFERLEGEARAEIQREGVAAERLEMRRSLELRYRGVDAAIVVARPRDDDYATAFAAAHQRLYGYVHAQRPLEVTAAHVEAVGRSQESLPRSERAPVHHPTATGKQPLFVNGVWQEVPLFARETLRPGAMIVGPAIISEAFTCTVLETGWQADLRTGGELVLTHLPADAIQPPPAESTATQSADPILLEVYNNLFIGIAEQMGHTLRNTASSVNVKERLDFSCAIFTADGDLVVNAPHIPVHLGAMGETVRRIKEDNPTMRPGDVFVTNDPYRGGSHLPDVTVVTPVFVPGAQAVAPRFFVANRAHHAEIGGMTPGSMPPFSHTLADEGVLIRNVRIVAEGQSRADNLATILRQPPFPSRAVDDNLADVSAQIAANQRGVEGLVNLVERRSLSQVEAYMRHIQAAAERKMRRTFASLQDGSRRFIDHLDDGTPIAVAFTVSGDEATIDFTGTGPVQPNNLNANRAITTAAVLYVLRLLVGEDVPLNQGLLAPVTLILPECLLNPPAHDEPAKCAAVVGGNVETSQRVVDVLLGAFGLAAASQGTMNNVLFGDATFGYYETICGGSGATASSDGCDAVHTHMTNTRLTDPEVFERRFPVRLNSFAVRGESGGRGEFCGGNGVIREIEFLRPVTISLLTQRRGVYRPYGVAGGEPGVAGRNRLRRATTGTVEALAGITRVEAEPGDVLIIETPGGGGWGNPP